MQLETWPIVRLPSPAEMQPAPKMLDILWQILGKRKCPKFLCHSAAERVLLPEIPLLQFREIVRKLLI